MSGKKEKRLLNKANIYNKEILVNFPHLKKDYCYLFRYEQCKHSIT